MIYDHTTMYYSIRFILAIILAIIVGIIFFKKKSKLILSIIVSFVIWLLTYIILGLLPVENFFFGFQTLEDAFYYSYNAEILAVDEHDDCALIISDDDSHGVQYYILNKKDGLWKVNVYPIIKRDEKWLTTEGRWVERIYIPKTDNCFIVCMSSYIITKNEVKSIGDNRSTEFKYFDSIQKDKLDFYYGLVEDMDEYYELYIDDDTIKFD